MKDYHKTQSRILLINDMAAYGKVALSVMIPVFSHMKYETFNLPTALVSNTLDYGKFDILNTTDFMKNTLNVWDSFSFSFDAICTGFVVSEEQASLLYDYCQKQRASGTLIVVDPIMGDDCKLYNGVTYETVNYMKKLCSTADIIIPNITEACFLSDHIVKHSYSKNEIEEIANTLHKLGAESVVITSTNINGKLFTVISNSSTETMKLIPYQEIPVRFPGTGDIFVSIMVGNFLKSGNIIKSVHSAMRQLENIILANINNSDKYKGIPIEQFLEDIIYE